MNCLWWPCLLMNRDETSHLYRGPFIDASYQVSVHLAQWFQRRLKKIGQSETRIACLWWPCLLMDWNKICNLYRGPSIDASYQVSVHLFTGFQRRSWVEDVRMLYSPHVTSREVNIYPLDIVWWHKTLYQVEPVV
jgi:hypothetical protein